MKKKLLWSAAVLFATLVVLTIVLWSTADKDEGPRNALRPEETAEGWLLLFDGETTKGWDIVGQVTVQGGLLILGGSQMAAATSTKTFEAFELRFEYRFEFGREGLLEMTWRGSRSGYGLGQLTSKPQGWSRAIYTRGHGTSKLQCEPFRKPLFQLMSSGPVQGTGDKGPIMITFRVTFPGHRLTLRNIKLKPRNGSDENLEGRTNR